MLQVKKTEYFSKWHANLKDARARAKINLRIEMFKSHLLHEKRRHCCAAASGRRQIDATKGHRQGKGVEQ